MYIITIMIIISLILLSEIVFGIIFISKLKKLINKSEPIIEVKDGLTTVNNFIRREFLFEFIKWIMVAPPTIDMSGPLKLPSFISDLKNPDILQEKMAIIATQIISKMSIYLIKEFSAMYNNSDDSELLYTYVSRQIMFYIRRVDFEITSLLEINSDVKPTDLLKQYVLSVESEIYKLNNILIIDESDKEENDKEENV